MRALVLLFGAACAADTHLVVQPQVAKQAVDPLAAIRPHAELTLYAIDRDVVDGEPLRAHYPLVGRNPTTTDDPAAMATVRDALATAFAVNWIHFDAFSLGLDLTPLRPTEELAPDGPSATLARFTALSEQIAPWCSRGPVRWASPEVKRDRAGHDSNTQLSRQGFTGAADGWGLVTVTAFRSSESETRPPAPWRIACSTLRGEPLRLAMRAWPGSEALLAHPDLRVTEHATHTLGRYITPEESCSGWRARGMTCDPISATLWAPRVSLPATEGVRALTLEDTHSQVNVSPFVHLGCDGTMRFVARFTLGNPVRIDGKKSGSEVEQIVRHLEMQPIMIDMVTGERLPADLPIAQVWDVPSGAIMSMSSGVPLCHE